MILAVPVAAQVSARVSLNELTDVLFDARDGAILAVTIDYGRWLRQISAAWLIGREVRDRLHRDSGRSRCRART